MFLFVSIAQRPTFGGSPCASRASRTVGIWKSICDSEFDLRWAVNVGLTCGLGTNKFIHCPLYIYVSQMSVATNPVLISFVLPSSLPFISSRPQEVVESRTEKTIEDVSTSSSSYLADNHVGPNRRFQQPPIQIPEEYREEWPRRGMESSILHELFERNGDSLARGIEELVEAAEDMVQEVFGPFGLADEALPRQPSEHREDRPSGWLWEKFLGRGQNERPKHNETNSQQSQPQKPADYSGLVRNIQEV